MLETYKEVLLRIVGSIGRKKSGFGLSLLPPEEMIKTPLKPYTLTVGSDKIIKVSGGYMISMSMSGKQLTKLRNSASELLSDHSPQNPESKAS